MVQTQSSFLKRPLSLPPTFPRSLTLTHPRSLSLPKLSLSIASKSSCAPVLSLSIASKSRFAPLERVHGGGDIGGSDSDGSGEIGEGGSGKRGGNGGSGALGGSECGGSGADHEETLKEIWCILIFAGMIQLACEMFVHNNSDQIIDNNSGQNVDKKSGGQRTRVLKIVKTSVKLLLLLTGGSGGGAEGDGGSGAGAEGEADSDWWEANSKFLGRAIISILLISSCIHTCFSRRGNNDDEQRMIRSTKFLKLVNMIANTILIITRI